MSPMFVSPEEHERDLEVLRALAERARADALREVADEMEAQARTSIALPSNGRKGRQRERNAIRGHAAAATLRWARTIRRRAEESEGMSEPQIVSVPGIHRGHTPGDQLDLDDVEARRLDAAEAIDEGDIVTIRRGATTRLVREDVPALVAEVRRLREDLRRVHFKVGTHAMRAVGVEPPA